MARRIRVRTRPLDGQKPTLEHRPGFLGYLLFYLGGLAFFASLAGAIYAVFNQYVASLGPALVHSAWAQVFHTQDPRSLVIRCAFNQTCKQAFHQVEVNYLYAVPYFFAGLIALAIGVRAIQVQARTKVGAVARWADRNHLKLLEREASRRTGYVGQLWEELPNGKPKPKPGPVIPWNERRRNNHILVLAGPGAGKTTGFFLPNLIRDAEDGNSAIVFDLKYPSTTGGLGEAVSYFYENGRNVFIFTPFSPHTMSLPLIQPGESYTSAMEVADLLVPRRDGEDERGDAFWRNLERALLSAMVYAVANDPREYPSIGRIIRLLLSGQTAITDYLGGHPHEDVRKRAGEVIYNLTHMGRDKVVGLLAGVTSRFLLFDERGLDLATSSPEGSIDLRRVFTEPSLLYIGLPQSQLQGSRGQVLLQLIKRVLDKMLLTVAAENGNRLPVHTVFYLDEFPSFGYLPNMDEMTATVRERRGSYIISLQNLAQGQRVYGRDTWDSILGNFQTIVTWPSKLTTRDRVWLRDHIGKTAVLERSYTEGLKPQDWERRFMEGFREAEKDLLSIEEMQIFPVAQGVVTTPGLPPFRVWLQGIFADAAVAKTTGLPVHPYAPRRATYLKTSPDKLIETISMVEGISVEEDKAPALPLAAHENPAYLAFLLWIDEVARAAPRVEPDGNGMILKNIPKGLANPDELGAWVKEGLLERVRGGLRVTPKGLSILNPKRRKALRWLAEADPLLHLLRKEARRIRGTSRFEGQEAVGEIRAAEVLLDAELAKQHLPPEILKHGHLTEEGKWFAFPLRVLPRF